MAPLARRGRRTETRTGAVWGSCSSLLLPALTGLSAGGGLLLHRPTDAAPLTVRGAQERISGRIRPMRLLCSST